MVAFLTIAVSLIAVVPAFGTTQLVARQAPGGFSIIPGLDKIDPTKSATCATSCTPVITAVAVNTKCVETAVGVSQTGLYTDCLCIDPVLTPLPACIKCLSDATAISATDRAAASKEYTDGCKAIGKDINLTGGTNTSTTGTNTSTKGTNTSTTGTNTSTTGTSTQTTGTNTQTTSTNGASPTQYTRNAMAAVGGEAIILAL